MELTLPLRFGSDKINGRPTIPTMYGDCIWRHLALSGWSPTHAFTNFKYVSLQYNWDGIIILFLHSNVIAEDDHILFYPNDNFKMFNRSQICLKLILLNDRRWGDRKDVNAAYFLYFAFFYHHLFIQTKNCHSFENTVCLTKSIIANYDSSSPCYRVRRGVFGKSQFYSAGLLILSGPGPPSHSTVKMMISCCCYFQLKQQQSKYVSK